jgi:hypothetical protein
MHYHSSGQERPIPDLDVPRKRDVVGDNNAVAQRAVVRYVSVGHDEAVGTDNSCRTRGGSAVHCHTLAYSVTRPNSKIASARLVTDILRFAAQHGAFVNNVVVSQTCKAFHDGVCSNFASVADFGICLNHRVWSDGDAHAEPGLGTDYCGTINSHIGD